MRTKHYYKKVRTGDKNPNWKGGAGHEYKDKDGRVSVCVAVGEPYVYRYRLVMEQHLGRKLLSTEIVHHKNEINDDDRLENLELFPNQAEHARWHGHNMSQERKDYLSKTLSGNNNPFYGKSHTEETKKKLSDIAKARKVHPRTGAKLSQETKDKISRSLRTYNRM